MMAFYNTISPFDAMVWCTTTPASTSTDMKIPNFELSLLGNFIHLFAVNPGLDML